MHWLCLQLVENLVSEPNKYHCNKRNAKCPSVGIVARSGHIFCSALLDDVQTAGTQNQLFFAVRNTASVKNSHHLWAAPCSAGRLQYLGWRPCGALGRVWALGGKGFANRQQPVQPASQPGRSAGRQDGGQAASRELR